MELFNSTENILWLIWLGIGVAFIITEMVIPGFIVIFFGVGALIAGATAFFGVSLQGQIIVFGVSSLALLFLLRRTMTATFAGGSSQDEEGKDPAIDALCEVVEAIIPPQAGRVKYQGSFWPARCDSPVDTGAIVRISRRDTKDPNTFIVKKES